MVSDNFDVMAGWREKEPPCDPDGQAHGGHAWAKPESLVPVNESHVEYRYCTRCGCERIRFAGLPDGKGAGQIFRPEKEPDDP